MAESENTTAEEPQSKDYDIPKLGRSEDSLYDLLELPKTATELEIKRQYRSLALKYHPDKNPDDAEAAEMFKKINKAHSILSDEYKRQIYDEYGNFGLYFTDRVGDSIMKRLMCLCSPRFKALLCLGVLLTGCCFCCSLCCCCFCCGCCGNCGNETDKEEEIPDADVLEEEFTQGTGSDPVTCQPTKNREEEEEPDVDLFEEGLTQVTDNDPMTSQPTKSNDEEEVPEADVIKEKITRGTGDDPVTFQPTENDSAMLLPTVSTSQEQNASSSDNTEKTASELHIGPLGGEEEEVTNVDVHNEKLSDQVASEPTENDSSMPPPPDSSPQEQDASSSDNTEKTPSELHISSPPPP